MAKHLKGGGRGDGGIGGWKRPSRGKSFLSPHPPIPLSPVVGIIGPGRAGLGLALALRRAGVRVLGVHGRRKKPVPRGIALSTGDAPPWLAAADVILLAVRDDALPEAVRRLRRRVRRGQIVLHLSGALTSRVLRPLAAAGARTGSMHPLMTVSGDPARAAVWFAAATFAVSGDAAALRAARQLVRALGGVAVRVPDQARALYHAGAVFASNYVVAMMGAAEVLLMASGFSERAARAALAPLAGASLVNVAAVGPARALTGPVARGDAQTVKRHLRALPRPLKGVYGAAGGVALKLAELAGLDAGRARAVRRALGAHGA